MSSRRVSSVTAASRWNFRLKCGVDLGRQTHLDPAERRENAERGVGRDRGRKVEPGAQQDADRGRDPDRGRRRQAAHGQPFLEDHAGAEKADAGHDALRHAGRIEADGLRRQAGAPLVLIEGKQHQQGRCESDQRVRAKAGRAAMEGPLEADQRRRAARCRGGC
jgi:hypothetical protein